MCQQTIGSTPAWGPRDLNWKTAPGKLVWTNFLKCKQYLYLRHIKAEILETTFSFRKFRAVPCHFRVPLMSVNHVVSNRSQEGTGNEKSFPLSLPAAPPKLQIPIKNQFRGSVGVGKTGYNVLKSSVQKVFYIQISSYLPTIRNLSIFAHSAHATLKKNIYIYFENLKKQFIKIKYLTAREGVQIWSRAIFRKIACF